MAGSPTSVAVGPAHHRGLGGYFDPAARNDGHRCKFRDSAQQHTSDHDGTQPENAEPGDWPDNLTSAERHPGKHLAHRLCGDQGGQEQHAAEQRRQVVRLTAKRQGKPAPEPEAGDQRAEEPEHGQDAKQRQPQHGPWKPAPEHYHDEHQQG